MQRKKSLILTTLLFFVIGVAFSAGQKESGDLSEVQSQEKTITVTDMAGRTVEIPANPERIATPNVDAFRMLIHLGAEDRLVGVPSRMYQSQFSEVETLEIKAWPESKNMPMVGGGPPGTEIDAEAIMALNPDLIFSWASGKDRGSQADRLQKQTGIPVVCINTWLSGNESVEEIRKAYFFLGKIVHKEERALELMNYLTDQVEIVKKIVNAIPQDSRPSVYFCSPGNLFRGTRNYFPAKLLGLNNVMANADVSSGEVAKEQFIKWDPEIIFMHTASRIYCVKSGSVANDTSIADVRAVKNNNYYHYKGQYMGWDVATGLVDLFYIGKIAYPEKFGNMEQKGEEILKEFYGVSELYNYLAENNLFKRW